MAEDQETSVGRHGIERETEKIQQPENFKNTLTVKQKSKIYLKNGT